MVGYAVIFFTISRSYLRNTRLVDVDRGRRRRVDRRSGAGTDPVPRHSAGRGIQADARGFDPLFGQRRQLPRLERTRARLAARGHRRLASLDRRRLPGIRRHRAAGWPVLPWQPSAGARTSREREAALLYGLLGLLAFWASFGPNAGLYTVLFKIPMFSFLRAPVRLGIVVVLCLSVLAGFALRRLLEAAGTRRQWLAGALTVAALAELTLVPFQWDRALVTPSAYQALAGMPRAPLAEFPFYGGRVAWHLHTQYMVFSTSHWLPLLNGYSDHTPRGIPSGLDRARLIPVERQLPHPAEGAGQVHRRALGHVRTASGRDPAAAGAVPALSATARV